MKEPGISFHVKGHFTRTTSAQMESPMEFGKFHQMKFGICAPYKGRASFYITFLEMLHAKDNTKGWNKLLVGTTKFGQGREVEFMFADLTRSRSDDAALGFMPAAKRLNVLLSKQQHGLVIVCDTACTNYDVTELLVTCPEDKDNEETTKLRQEITDRANIINKRNKDLIKVFERFRGKGRIADIPLSDLPEDHLKLDIPSSSAAKTSVSSVVDDPKQKVVEYGGENTATDDAIRHEPGSTTGAWNRDGQGVAW